MTSMATSFEIEDEEEEYQSLIGETEDGQSKPVLETSLPDKTTSSSSRTRTLVLLGLFVLAAFLLLSKQSSSTTIIEPSPSPGVPSAALPEDTQERPPPNEIADEPTNEPSEEVDLDDDETPFDDDNDDDDDNESPDTNPKGLPDDSTPSEDAPIPADDKAGFLRPPVQLNASYVPRAQPVKPIVTQQLASTMGSWNFVDSKANQRPTKDFYADYPNRDVPLDKFPPEAWQTDAEYLKNFLPEAIALVERAMEAILAEYGQSPKEQPGKSFEERSDMFQVDIVDLAQDNPWNAKIYTNAGWLSQQAHEGLKRRLLHAIMTEDTFRFVMAGHSAAAGHGNHFQQSYTMQFQKTMEPVMARLGVYMESHNFGMGGLGTLHNAVGAPDIYGPADLLMWDSGMTEKAPGHLDIFYRQGLLARGKVPILLGGLRGVLQDLAMETGAEVADFGSEGCSMRGISMSTDGKQVTTLPWATRYIECEKELAPTCRKAEVKYRVECWIERDDVEPAVEQAPRPGGQVSWHPGWRIHQLRGRALAFPVLMALREVLQTWNDADNYVLPDDAWHVTDLYNSIQSKVATASEEAPCFTVALPNSFCRYPVHSRTEFTPRANPMFTSLRSILKQHPDHDQQPPPNLYDPPDVFLDYMEPPQGATDYLNIIENGLEFVPTRGKRRKVVDYELRPPELPDHSHFEPGKGWFMQAIGAADHCDGTYDSFCGRQASNDCLLYQHNDARSGIMMDSLSGWVVMKLSAVEHGAIVVKMETWHPSGANWKTEGWTCENNECRGRMTNGSQHLRQTKATPPELCDQFAFEFAIDGKVTSWNKAVFLEKEQELQRVMQVWTLMDDPEFAKDGAKDIEVALRMQGCERHNSFLLTHIYWH